MTAPDLAALEAAHPASSNDPVQTWDEWTVLITDAFPGILAHIKEQAAEIERLKGSDPETCPFAAEAPERDAWLRGSMHGSKLERRTWQEYSGVKYPQDVTLPRAELAAQAARIAELEGQVAATELTNDVTEANYVARCYEVNALRTQVAAGLEIADSAIAFGESPLVTFIAEQIRRALSGGQG